jgi:hypothetical protein
MYCDPATGPLAPLLRKLLRLLPSFKTGTAGRSNQGVADLVARFLMLKCQHRCAATRQLRTRRSGGFDKGRLPVRLPGDRAAFWHARVSPIWAAARVPLSNPPRTGNCSVRTAARRSSWSSRQPTGVRPAVAGALAGAETQAAVSAARAARRAALKDVQKALTSERARSNRQDHRVDQDA